MIPALGGGGYGDATAGRFAGAGGGAGARNCADDTGAARIATPAAAAGMSAASSATGWTPADDAFSMGAAVWHGAKNWAPSVTAGPAGAWAPPPAISGV